MELKELDESFKEVEKLTIPKIWQDIDQKFKNTFIVFKIILFLMSIVFNYFLKLFSKFYRNTLLSLILFGVNFYFYLPFYEEVSSFLSIIGENIGFTVFFLSGLGLIMTIPMLFKKIKRKIFEVVAKDPRTKTFENFYAGLWVICIFYILLLDSVIIILNLLEFVGLL